MKKLTLILSAAVLLFSACEKDDDDNTDNTPTTGLANLGLVFHSKAGDQDLVLNQPYTNEFNQNFDVELSQFYISDVKLWADASGNTKVSIPDSYFLFQPTHKEFNLGMVPSGTYYGVEFVVGIADSATNHGDPALQDGVLAPQNPSMHWSWNSGYIFVRLEGSYAKTQGGAPTNHYEFHLGMDNLARTVEISKEIEVTYGASNSAMIMVDHKAFLKGVDFSADTVTHTMDYMMLAMKIANNLPNAFE